MWKSVKSESYWKHAVGQSITGYPVSRSGSRRWKGEGGAYRHYRSYASTPVAVGRTLILLHARSRIFLTLNADVSAKTNLKAKPFFVISRGPRWILFIKLSTNLMTLSLNCNLYQIHNCLNTFSLKFLSCFSDRREGITCEEKLSKTWPLPPRGAWQRSSWRMHASAADHTTTACSGPEHHHQNFYFQFYGECATSVTEAPRRRIKKSCMNIFVQKHWITHVSKGMYLPCLSICGWSPPLHYPGPWVIRTVRKISRICGKFYDNSLVKLLLYLNTHF